MITKFSQIVYSLLILIGVVAMPSTSYSYECPSSRVLNHVSPNCSTEFNQETFEFSCIVRQKIKAVSNQYSALFYNYDHPRNDNYTNLEKARITELMSLITSLDGYCSDKRRSSECYSSNLLTEGLRGAVVSTDTWLIPVLELMYKNNVELKSASLSDLENASGALLSAKDLQVVEELLAKLGAGLSYDI